MIIDTGRQIELLLEHEKHILDMVAAQKPLASILETISQRVEVQFPNTYCSIMLLDANEGVLFPGASSSLPESIRDVLDQGMVIGACAANCDTADYRRQPVLVSDIRDIPLWQGWHHLFAENGIVACSTFPIVEAAGAVLGTFALYYDRAYRPTGNEQQVIERMSCLAGIAIGRAKEQKSLRDSEQRFRDFAEIAADWFWETDAQLRLTYLSENHQIITDLSLADSLGRYFDELYKTESIPVHSYAEDTDPGRNAGSAGKKFRFEETSLIIRETRLVRADGDEIDIYLQAKRLFDADGKFIGCRGIGRDITAQRRLNEKIVYQASHDPLTGLLNRRAFQAQLEKAVADARKNNKAYVFCFIDLDQFKLVNDSVGHVAGDELLKAVSGLILTEIRSIDVLGRLGGDEFGLLLRACPLSKAKDIAEAMLQKLRAYCFRWHEREFYIQASIGIVAIGAHAHSATELMAQADLACFCAKEQGRNQVVIYDEKVMRDNSALASATRWLDAFQQQRLLLYAQPIRSLQTADDQFPWYEILLRLQDNDGSLVAPRPFVLAAEHFGLMASVDHWVIQQALKELKKLLKRNRKARFSINLSGISLDSNNLAEFIINQLRYHGIPADGVCFEITETAAIRNLSEATRLIEKLREFGCHFALDDFGSGLSSFTYLKYLPVGFLKIDGGFIVDMLTEATDYAMVEAIHNIGSKLNLVTIAESVESVATVDALRDIGVDYAQGYALAYPQPCAHIHTGGVVIPPNVAGNS